MEVEVRLHRQDRLLGRRIKQAHFRDAGKTLDSFALDSTRRWTASSLRARPARFVERRKDVLFLGAPGTGRSHLAQAIALSAFQQGHKVLSRGPRAARGARRCHAQAPSEAMTELATVPLLVIDDIDMRKLPTTAAEDLREVIMRRYERVSTLITSKRSVDTWSKLPTTAAVTSSRLA